MSKEQIAFWGASGLSARVNTLETKTTLNEENIILLNARTLTLEDTVFPVVYGSFSSTQTQPIPAEQVSFALTYDTTDIAQGCELSGGNPSPKVQVFATGIYRVLFSIQVNRNGGGVGSLFAYPIINSAPVPNSTTKMALNGNQEDCLTVEYILSLTEEQTITIQCYSATAGQEALAIPQTDEYPATPSIILTLNRIG
jgi:hypothetical protein